MVQSIVLVFIITTLVYFENVEAAAYSTTIVSKEGTGCSYDKYEGGDGTVNISPIPKIEAVVPVCVLAEMMGADTNEFFKRADLTANGMMHFTNAVKGFTGALEKIAPKLAPCLGLIGVGFGFLKPLTQVSPADIMEKVNEAIEELRDQTNRRLEQLQNYVDEEIRNNFAELMNDFYKADFEAWNDCLLGTTRMLVDECQREMARTIKRHRLLYMFQTRYETNPNDNIPIQDLKMLELQLPVLKQQADLHLLALGALLRTYEDGKGEGGLPQYRVYKAEYIAVGEYYVGYMKWAYDKIFAARITNQVIPRVSGNLCEDIDDDIRVVPGRFTPGTSYITRSSRECQFTCTNMKRDFDCAFTSKLTCPPHECFTMLMFTNYGTAIYHQQVDSVAQNEMNTVCGGYKKSLKRDLTNFFNQSVTYFIPTIEETIERVRMEPEPEPEEGEDSTEGGDTVTDGNRRSNLESTKEEIEKEKKANAEEKALLDGTNERDSFENYFKKVMSNARKEILGKKKKNKKTQKNKKKNLKKVKKTTSSKKQGHE